MTSPPLLRPEPIVGRRVPFVDPKMSPLETAMRLAEGASFLLSGRFSVGSAILDALEKRMPAPPVEAPYEVRQAHRQAFREASRRLFAPVTGQAIALVDAPPIGFLADLYPEGGTFLLPFVDLEDLHNAWGYYQRGVFLAVLGFRVHPFYGTYAPTRVVHLELFATWLSQYKGARERAIDVGTGCGVLALQLAKAGFGRILATDINPNAVESVRREVRGFPNPPPIDVQQGDLLEGVTAQADLIVFNPPWTQGPVKGPLDRALVYDDDLFERFFAQAHDRLTPEGRVVILFSNLIRLVQPDVPHPLDAELELGRFTLVQKMTRKVKPSRTATGGKGRPTREHVEVWELARAVAD